MEWKGLSLHIENLLPGVVTLLLLLSLLPAVSFERLSASATGIVLKNDLVAAVSFIAASYLLGVIAIAVSRFALDRLSEAFPRPALLRLLSRTPFNDRDRRYINGEYREAIKRALCSTNETVKAEVLRRRERGRLVRTTLVPAALLAVHLSGNSITWGVVSVVGAIAAILCVYAYVECTIYEECLFVDSVQPLLHPVACGSR